MSRKQQITAILTENPDGLTVTEIAALAGIDFWRAAPWTEPALAELMQSGKITRQKEPEEGLVVYSLAPCA